MEEYKVKITILLIASVVMFFAPMVTWFVRRLIRWKSSKACNRSTIGRMFIFSVCLFISLFCLRYAMGYYTIISANAEANNLTWWEEIFSSILKALHTFSIDEKYAEYITSGKEMIATVFGNNAAYKTVYGLYDSLLCLIAPIAGGVFIFEILASVFPKIMLWTTGIFFWKERCYFSELNSASLALAKSICEDVGFFEKPIIVFTDAYVDKAEEKEYELLLEAKRHGAICVRDDLAHVRKRKRGKRTYYLVDVNEFGNLQTLMDLTKEENIKFIKNSKIYLFVESDAYVQIEKKVNKIFDEHKKKSMCDQKPTISPINVYRNLVQNLFVDVPLYEPLIGNNKTKLNVTILGNGIIGTEAFLNAYWFGQMLIGGTKDGKATLDECDMTINIASKDTSEVFWSKIDYINPEIKRSIEVINENGSGGFDKKLLCFDNTNTPNSPYCKVRYVQSDVEEGYFWDETNQDAQNLLRSDYFIVALGDDVSNISVAEKIRRYVGKKHLEGEEDATDNTVIAYAVFDSKLAEKLNSKKDYQCRVKGKTDIFMHAFGNMDQVYSDNNVNMSKFQLLAKGIGKIYDKMCIQDAHIKENKKRATNEDRNYTYWADCARAMHVEYKAFSMGLINKSVFDGDVDVKYTENQCKLYKKLSKGKWSEADYTANGITKEEVASKKEVLAWLEHRRWNAFTRIMGYQHTSEFKKNLALNGTNHKNMELKLHPCLVEAKKPSFGSEEIYMSSIFDDKIPVPTLEEKDNRGKAEMISLLKGKIAYLELRQKFLEDIKNNVEELDFLDKITYEWRKEATRVSLFNANEELKALDSNDLSIDKKNRQEFEKKFLRAWNGIDNYNFKMYDYCEYDFDEGGEKGKCTNLILWIQAKLNCLKNFLNLLKK